MWVASSAIVVVVTTLVINIFMPLLIVFALMSIIGSCHEASGMTSEQSSTAEGLAEKMLDVNSSANPHHIKLSAKQVAAILSNFKPESGFKSGITGRFGENLNGQHDKDSNEAIKSWTMASTGHPIGLAQWTRERAVKLVELADRNNKPWQDENVQLEFLFQELQGYGKTLEAMENVATVTDAAGIFYDSFERGGDAARPPHLLVAQEIYDRIKNVGKDTNAQSPVVNTSGTMVMTPSQNNSAIVAEHAHAADNGVANTLCNDIDDIRGTSDVIIGGVVGDVPQGAKTYEWMCKGAGVCHDGDSGKNVNATNIYRSYGYQCTWYALTRLSMIHHDWSTSLGGHGGQMWGNARSTAGWTTGSARAGAGVSFNWVGNPYGHVAVVEKVFESNGQKMMTISEGNFNVGGGGYWNGFNVRTIPVNDPSVTGFFWKTSWNMNDHHDK